MVGYLAESSYKGKVLILPQFGMPDFFDSPRRVLPALRSRLGGGKGQIKGGRGTGVGM